jgi:hypothetical protein
MRGPVAAWLGSRALVVVLVLGVAVVAGVGAEAHPLASGWWWLDRFTYWDSFHFTRIADDGYFGPGRACCDQSYFPAYPLAVRWLGWVLPGPSALAGFVVSIASGAVAAFAMHRLALAEGLSRRAAGWAVGLLAVAPFTVFTVAVYSESLWLAGALLAWWAGRRERWWLAGLAAGLACATRVTGVFLVAGLVVMYAVAARRRARGGGGRMVRPDVLFVVPALLPVVAFMAWLRARTGSWNAWREAQSAGWAREQVAPWTGVAKEWAHVIDAPNVWLGVPRALDLVAILAGALLAVLLATRRHRWADAAFVGISVATVLTTTNWDSAGRYSLAWFPAYLVVANAGERPGWGRVRLAVGVGSALLALLVVLWFASRHWIG